jgi:hypothetical protein
MGAPPATGWWSKNWKWVVLLGCLVPTVCCGASAVVAVALGLTLDPDGVRVDCGEPGPRGVECTLKRTSGAGACEACWDLEIACANGAVMVGHACGSLGAGESDGRATMPVDAFSNQDACDAPASGTVTNLQVTSR